MKLKFFCRERAEDTIWLILNEILYPFISAGISFKLGQDLVNQWQSQKIFVIDLKNSSIYIQLFAFYLLIDFVSFIFHYSVHRLNILWGLHVVHHTTIELNVLSAFRSSWSQNITQAIFFGFATSWLSISDSARGVGNFSLIFICMVQHMNTRAIFPQWVEKILVTPKNHFWHHSKYKYQRYGQNFGLIFTLWDHLIGSYYNPKHFNTEIGPIDANEKFSLLEKLIGPILRYVRSSAP